MNDEKRRLTIGYQTYIFEFWIILFSWGETEKANLNAEQIGMVWREAKFGNLGRVAGTVLYLSIFNYFLHTDEAYAEEGLVRRCIMIAYTRIRLLASMGCIRCSCVGKHYLQDVEKPKQKILGQPTRVH